MNTIYLSEIMETLTAAAPNAISESPVQTHHKKLKMDKKMKKILNSKFCLLHLRRRRAGFTLVEMLVVISIIGILATVLLANYTASRGRARDAQRKSDIREIQTALELYKGSQKPPAYPPALTNLSPSYMKTVAHDPSCTGGTCTNWIDYSYTRDGSDTLKYTLKACLENASDPQKDSSLDSYCSGRPASFTRTEP